MCTPVDTNKRFPSRGGSETQFPGKLHDLMTYIEKEGLDDIISWVRNGRAFKVHKPEKLLEILPIFFGQTKYRSFQRQLNMWHFERIQHGPDKGGFMHPYFVRGNKALCAYMSRHLFDMPTPPTSMIESGKCQKLDVFDFTETFATDFTDIFSTESTEWMELSRQLNEQFVSTVDLNRTPVDNQRAPISLNAVGKDQLDFLGRKFHGLEDPGHGMNRHYDKPAFEKTFSNAVGARDPESSTRLSQLLEPISPEVFETLF